MIDALKEFVQKVRQGDLAEVVDQPCPHCGANPGKYFSGDVCGAPVLVCISCEALCRKERMRLK